MSKSSSLRTQTGAAPRTTTIFAARAMTSYHYLGRPPWPISYRLALLLLLSTDPEIFCHQNQIG